MEAPMRITLTEYCRYHQGVQPEFVRLLIREGLLDPSPQPDSEDPVLDENLLPALEQLSRMHYDLDINIPGVEAIGHLLARMQAMQEELQTLRNRLDFYQSAM